MSDRRRALKPSFRKTLEDSRIGAVAIALLLVWAFEAAFNALWDPMYRLGSYFVTAILIRDIPLFSYGSEERRMLANGAVYFAAMVSDIGAAWAVSHWIYSAGPLCSLKRVAAFLENSKRD